MRQRILIIEVNNTDNLRMHKKANTEERQFMTDITSYVNDNGLGALYGHEYEGYTNIQRHHVVGKSAKQNKVPIGHWFINPVPYELHEPNEKHKHHVGHCKKAFVKKFGNQRDIYCVLRQEMKEHGYNVCSDVVYNAIMSTSA